MSMFIDSDSDTDGNVGESEVPLLASTMTNFKENHFIYSALDEFLNTLSSFIGFRSCRAITINPRDGIQKDISLSKLATYCIRRQISIILYQDRSVAKNRLHYHGLVVFKDPKASAMKNFQVHCNKTFGHVDLPIYEEGPWLEYMVKHDPNHIVYVLY